MRTRAVLCRIALLAVVVGAFVPPAHAASVGEGVSPRVIDRIEDFRQETWRWQKLMGRQLSPTRHLAERSAPGFHSRTLALWRKRAAKARYAAKHPKRLRAWLCIHRYEGPWNAHTGNGYYGGLQMDIASSGGTAPAAPAKARPPGGRQSSRCGSPSGRTKAAAASIRGPTRPGTAGSSRTPGAGRRASPARPDAGRSTDGVGGTAGPVPADDCSRVSPA